MTSEHTDLLALIGQTWQEMGGRGTKADVLAHLRLMVRADSDAVDYLLDQGLGSKISQYFRQITDSGLPQAAAIDSRGTHAQLELWDEGEYRFVIARHMASSEARRQRALEYSNHCYDRLGVRIDIENPYDVSEAS